MTATAVLLPVRIETVLDRPKGDEGEWVLRFRLIPDVVSVVPVVSGSTEQTTNAQSTREWASQVAGYPSTMLVSVERVGLPPASATLIIKRDALALPSDETDLVLASSEQWDPGATGRKAQAGPWWLSYSGAVAVGLGGEIPLGADRGEIIAVYAVGVGSDPAKGVLRAQARQGRLARVPVGTATNAVAGDPPATLHRVSEAKAASVLRAEPNLRRQQMITALWSALFGDALVEVFGAPRERIDALAEWCADWLAPDGLRSAIAIKDVPYGVFAATDLRSLAPLKGDELSTDVATIVSGLVPVLATRAEQRPHSASDVDDLVERLGRQAASGRFRLRAARDVSGTQADHAYLAAVSELLPLGIVPTAVHPLPDAGSEQYPRAVFLADDEERRYLESMLAALLTAVDQFPMKAKPEELPNPARSAGLFIKVLDRSIRAEVATNSEASVGRLRTVIDLLRSIADAGDFGGIERGTRGLVDATGQRIDPWAVALAEQRWDAAGGGGSSPLGLYGWVDGPIEPARLRGEFTLAPSVTQATVAAIALDRHLTHGDPDPERWRMTLDSAAIRAAEEIGAELRAGAHLAEAIGRSLERYAPEQLRQDLRDAFPCGEGGPERSALHGMNVLSEWNASRDLGVGALPPALEKELDRLSAGVDAYADLLVIDGIKNVVDGRPDLAKANLDAAAGLTAPASFDVLSTPRTAGDARTIVLAAVPFVRGPKSPDTAYEAADSSMSSYLNGLALSSDLGYDIAAPGHAARRVTLEELGVDVATAAVLPPVVLERAVRLLSKVDGDAVLNESPRLGEVRRRAAAMTGAVPEAASSELDAVDDAAELTARLKSTIELARAVAGGRPGLGAARAAQRGRLLGFGLTTAPDGDVALAVAELSARADVARKVADDRSVPPSRIAAALRSMLGGSDTAMPISRGAELPARKPASNEVLRDWLSTLSALRVRLAAVDVELLARSDLQLTTTTADPWRRDGDPTTTMFAVLAPKGFRDGGAAVSVIDSFAESIPASSHDAGMAFHFDAPTARAPQAILLAVSSDPDIDELEPSQVLSIVKATRELSHARMFQLRDDPTLAAVAPTALFPFAPFKLDGRLP